MADEKELNLGCPFCKAELTVDRDSGELIDAQPAPGRRSDFESALGDALSAGERREHQFKRAFKSERNRSDLLSKKFEKAQRKALEKKPPAKD